MKDRTRRERPRGRGPARGPAGVRRRSVWRGPLPIVGTVLAVAAVVGIFVVTSRAPAAPEAPSTANAAVATKVTSLPPAVFDAVVGGSTGQTLKAVSGGDPLIGPSGKPMIVYVGAEFCPFCASQRWSMVIALSRFGTWSGLTLSRSSSTDAFPNTPTFTFRGAAYASDVLELSAVETSDRDGKPLATMSPTQRRSMDRFDPPSSIPFLSIADRFYVVGSGFPPDVLAGKSWDDVATALRDPSSPVAKAIVGNADRMTAAICAVTRQQPAPVCSSPSVQGLLPVP